MVPPRRLIGASGGSGGSVGGDDDGAEDEGGAADLPSPVLMIDRIRMARWAAGLEEPAWLDKGPSAEVFPRSSWWCAIMFDGGGGSGDDCDVGGDEKSPLGDEDEGTTGFRSHPDADADGDLPWPRSASRCRCNKVVAAVLPPPMLLLLVAMPCCSRRPLPLSCLTRASRSNGVSMARKKCRMARSARLSDSSSPNPKSAGSTTSGESLTMDCCSGPDDPNPRPDKSIELMEG